MNEEMKTVQKDQPKHSKGKMSVLLIILTALVTAELYLMINLAGNYLLIGGVALVMLCLVYLVINTAFKMKDEQEELHKKEYESLYKAQKVSYILMKQNFMDLLDLSEKILKSTESDLQIDELLRAQKGVAKVTIQRNKENALAIMNCNDKLLERMTAMEEILQGAVKEPDTSSQEAVIAGLKEELLAKQKEMMTSVDKLGESLKAEFLENISSMTSRIEKDIAGIQVAAPGVSAAEKPAEMSAEELERVLLESSRLMAEAEEPVMPQAEPVADQAVVSEPTVEKPVEEPIVEESSAGEPAAQEADESVNEEPVSSEPVHEPMIDEAVIGESVMEEPVISEPVQEPVVDESIMQETVASDPVVQEPVIDEIVSEEPVISEPVQEPVMEEPVIEESSVSTSADETPEAVIISEDTNLPEEVVEEEVVPESAPDPNHIMTPDEIAALLGETESVIEEEPVKEEKAPMPDLSNPNHVMTPEEIAALLANM
ncbi:hypothetical protein H8S17_06985 [Roseburia sp. BX1005]|uniref:Uncharacterized protein n=1 Tax=Roseburia zhanii TaxID=2763064 RepID=A0A923LNB1_9FIRM|nr:hypothetical protein [Roseburia zhanii]MBC5713957.1 hypothetical protein [Roseburia zhanii]